MSSFDLPAFVLTLRDRVDRHANIHQQMARIPRVRYRLVISDRDENPVLGNLNSHIEALRRGRRVKTNYFLIFEDDFNVKQPADFVTQIHTLVGQLDKWDILVLGCLTTVPANSSGPLTAFAGAQAYLVNKASVDKIICHLMTSQRIEWGLCETNVYVARPLLCDVITSPSSISKEVFDAPELHHMICQCVS